jgi:hypothetical protein
MPRLVGFSRFSALLEELDQRKDQPLHSLRRPRDDRMEEHRGRRPCRATVTRMSRSCGCSKARWSSASASNPPQRPGCVVRHASYALRRLDDEVRRAGS